MRAMKDSGVEWIGVIPIEWKSLKIRNICKRISENQHPDATVLSLYRDLGIVIKSERDDNFNRTSENTDNYKYVEQFDLVVNKMKAWQGSVAVSPYQGIVSPAYYVFRFTHVEVFPFYIHYLLRCSVFLPEYRRLSGGIRPDQWDLNESAFLNITIVLPPLAQQKGIAAFLDAKCAQIDAIIKKQQQVIEKLKAYKQSMITEAVTKGLDPTVPMKDSGVEWIGMVPEHWEIRKLKCETSMMRGRFSHRPRNDPDYYDGDFPFVQTGDVARANKYITDYSQSLNELGFSVSKEFPKGSIVMTIAANVGDVAVLDFDACFPDSIIGFIPHKSIHWNFMYYVFKSMKNQLLRNAIISTQLNLNIEIIKEEYIPIAPFIEQEIIIQHLDNVITSIGRTIQQKEDVITKLNEYKKSLIYEAVTGKMEVL